MSREHRPPGRAVRRFAAAICLSVAVAAAFLIQSSPSGGFGTVTRFGQNAEHERITRAALACTSATPPDRCFEPLSILSLAGGPGSFGGVGSPDSDEIFTPAAHCDDADFLDGVAYKQTRREATAQLVACRTHLQARFQQGVAAAAGLLDANDHIDPAGVDLSTTCTFFGERAGRAKCEVLEGLGRALHGTEDFYSHSNWADESDPGERIKASNPPGLGNDVVAPFLDLRAAVAPAIPDDLSTGCFSLVPFACSGRVDHGSLNKDNGIVDPVTGATRNPSTPRGRVGTNFESAVAGAIAEAKRQWNDLADELVATYGPTKANLMICAITRDNPVQACTGRRIALVLDSSSNTEGTDQLDRRIASARSLNDRLVAAGEAAPGQRGDMTAVVDASNPPRVVSPLGDAASTSFSGIDATGGLDLAGGIGLALDELARGADAGSRDRDGIVIYTDATPAEGLEAAIARADQAGVRVSLGLLAPPPDDDDGTTAQSAQAQPQEPPETVIEAVLATGGSFAVMDSEQAERDFIDQLARSGLTHRDDSNGAADDGSLEHGVEAVASESPGGAPDHWTHHSRPGTEVTAAVRSLEGGELEARLVATRTGRTLDVARASGSEQARLDGRSAGGEVELTVSAISGGGLYEIEFGERGVEVDGTRRAERLGCSRGPAYVTAGRGRDAVRCSGRDDTIDGGPGADRLRGRAGDDIFVIRRGDLERGVERVYGGAGRDVALFLFDRPRGTRCEQGTAARVPLGRGARYRLRGIERVRFEYRPCAAGEPVDALARLHGTGVVPVPRPPTPSLSVRERSREAIDVAVQVDDPTSLMATGKVRVDGRRMAIEPVLRDVPAGTHELTLQLPQGSARRVRVVVIAGGVKEGPTQRSTLDLRLPR